MKKIPGQSTRLQKLWMKILVRKKCNNTWKEIKIQSQKVNCSWQTLAPLSEHEVMSGSGCSPPSPRPHCGWNSWRGWECEIYANKPRSPEISWPTIHVLFSFWLARIKTNPMIQMLGASYQKWKSHMMDKAWVFKSLFGNLLETTIFVLGEKYGVDPMIWRPED